MKKPSSFYFERNGTEEGPFTAAQINRKKQTGEISADTLCRKADDSSFRRLDIVFPHLRDYRGVEPQKMEKLKSDMKAFEIRSLKATAFGTGAFFWAPGGPFLAITAIVCGFVLLIKHRQMIGLGAIALGGFGLYVRTLRVWMRTIN